MTGGMIHREEIAHLAPDLVCLMQQVDIASVPVAQVERNLFHHSCMNCNTGILYSSGMKTSVETVWFLD